MKILFWGTPAYAVPSLDALVAAGHSLVGVVSQPDRRRGRGKELMPSPVKARAQDLGIPVFTPSRIRRDLECQRQLADLKADVFVVVAFGQILPPEVLAQPPLGCWNGHGSLLPRWRGAGPIQWSLIEGDAETGVGIMAMEEGLDTGPVLLERAIHVGLRENAQQLSTRLAALTGALLVEAMPLIEAAGQGSEADRLQRLGVVRQCEEGMTYARMLSKEDFRIDWDQSALSIHRRVMGLFPGAFTTWHGRRLKLLDSEPLIHRLVEELSPEAVALTKRWGMPAPEREPGAVIKPGTILDLITEVGVVVATDGCPLLIRQAQLEGKAAVAGTTLLQQLQAKPGDRLGNEE